MLLPPAPRKALLIIHIAASVGWIGALLAYLALDVATVASGDPATLRAAYAGMDLIAGAVILPLALAALATGILASLLTTWGLFRHWWVVISLVLTVLAVAVLLVELSTIEAHAARAADPATSDDALRALPSTLPHSIGGLVVLLVALVLNVVKPKGLTPYGWRSRHVRSRGPDDQP